ncbi:hypothetical protein PPE_05260 [Paenibacillus polymyxa E681]|nr:hypothetical protein PPE_05260 [Paenibacillus polymyxa E681]
MVSSGSLRIVVLVILEQSKVSQTIAVYRMAHVYFSLKMMIFPVVPIFKMEFCQWTRSWFKNISLIGM